MAKLMGCQNPSSSVFLISEEKTTEYEKAVNLYNETGRTAQEWQCNILKHLLSKNEDDLWVHTKFGYSIPRRNGKSEIIIMRVLHGLEEGEKMLYTAHRTTTSHSFFERVEESLASLGYIKASEVRKDDDVPIDMIFDSYKANGLESIVMRKNKARINFRTRTSKGGLGEGYDVLIIDEAQEDQDDQESSLKYVVTDSKNPQTIMCGTPPTAVSAGTVFVKLREKCLLGEMKNTGWAEWSVERMTDPNDRDAWVRTNPSLGTVFTERSIEDEIGTDDSDFNIQRLGLWLKYNQKSAISEAIWNGLKVETLPKLKGQMHIGIKFGKDGQNIAMSVAVKSEDGKVFVEGLYQRPTTQGIDWIINFLKKADYAACICDGKNGQQMIEDAAKENKLKKISFPTVADVINANAVFEQALYSKNICHNGQPMLTTIVSNCKKRTIGSNGGFGYEAIIAETDVALMDSMVYAYWSAQKSKERKKPKISY